MELLEPKDDFVFYWLFGRKEETKFVKDFLSALFDEEITKIEHLIGTRESDANIQVFKRINTRVQFNCK